MSSTDEHIIVNKSNYLSYTLTIVTILSILIVSYSTLIEKKIEIINTQDLSTEET